MDTCDVQSYTVFMILILAFKYASMNAQCIVVVSLPNVPLHDSSAQQHCSVNYDLTNSQFIIVL